MVDVIIIGGGPAGLTAALNVKRAGKSCLILEKENIGGQIANSPRVENIPGYESIAGLEFIDKLFEQVSSLGAEFKLEEVLNVTKVNDIIKVKTNYDTHECYSLIIATGVIHRHIGIENEDKFIGKGISYCAVCDGAFYKDDDVVLIGDANTALQYALLLSQYCKHVYLNTLFDKFFADNILVQQLNDHENIIVRHNLSLVKINGDKELSGLTFKDTVTEELVDFNVKGCFIAIGQIPSNEVFQDYITLRKGFIVTDENLMTNVEGIYAVGDCRDKKVRQLVTAFGDASIGALNACSYVDIIKNKKGEK